MKNSSKGILIISGIVLVIAAVVGALFWFDIINLKKTDEVVIREQVKEKSADTISIGLAANYPPMEFLDANANVVGFDIDLIAATLDGMGQPYELVLMEWYKYKEMLESREIDLFWSTVNITDERKTTYELSDSYLKGEQLIVVAADSDITLSSLLADKRVAVQTGTFVLPMVEDFGKNNALGDYAEILDYPQSALAMTAILTGDVDAFIGDAVNILYYVKNSPGKFRILSEPFLETEGYAVAALKGETEIINRVNKELSKMRNNGTLESIYAKWFGK